PGTARAACATSGWPSSSQSTSTTFAPSRNSGRTVAMNVFAGAITSSPGPMPATSYASASAAVPEDTPTQCPVPQRAAHSDSKLATSAPRMYCVDAMLASTAASISSLIVAYWRLRSTKLTLVTPPACTLVVGGTP